MHIKTSGDYARLVKVVGSSPVPRPSLEWSSYLGSSSRHNFPLVEQVFSVIKELLVTAQVCTPLLDP